MTITLQSLEIAGLIANIPSGAVNLVVTLPNPASDYVLVGQTSQPVTCWLSAINGNQATFSFGAPVPTGSTLTVVALPIGLSGLNTVVLPPNTPNFSVTIPTGQSILPIPEWNTQIWYAVSGNTWTFYFNAPSTVSSYFSYLIVGPGQNSNIASYPIDPNAYNATFAIPSTSLYLPIAAVTWNTAIGVEISGSSAILQFSNGAPEFAATAALIIGVPINISLMPLPAPATVPVQAPWVVTTITPEQWATRMFALFPYPWLGDAARTVSGIAYALFLAIGTNLNFISAQLYYAWTACRLATATDIELDYFAQDYFGQNLPRLMGETDAAYRARIEALLLQPQVTREAIVNAIEYAFPGTVVRVIEPWNPSDTGYYGAAPPYIGSYYDYDSEAVPSVYGDSERYTGYLQIQLPAAAPLSYFLWGFDFGAAYDSETGYFFELFQEIQSLIGQINNLINRIVLEGTTIYVKYINQTPTGKPVVYPIGGSFYIATGQWNFTIGGISYPSLYVLFVQLSQPINIWGEGFTPSTFLVVTSAPIPSSTQLNYLALPKGISALNQATVALSATTLFIPVNTVLNVALVQPAWNTTIWYTSRASSGMNLEFSTPSPFEMELNYLSLPLSSVAGYQGIQEGTTSLTISLPVGNLSIPFVMPNWNTSVGCLANPINNTILVTFAVPAPVSAELMYLSYQI